ncbi:MAG TPA: cytochrome c [Candidatus Angelobacter sp.]|nr:cytochrome c [Candidatus Angelobacter sp.]
MSRTSSIPLLLMAGLLLEFSAGCEPDRSKMSDAELGLNAQQARGRRVYNIYCLGCHPAYSSHGDKGPGLKDLYKKPYLPSGLTATDEHVAQSIVQGRNMMPRFSDQLDRQDVQDLIAYLRTL